jgi:hypothetical protein
MCPSCPSLKRGLCPILQCSVIERFQRSYTQMMFYANEWDARKSVRGYKEIEERRGVRRRCSCRAVSL